MPSPITKSDAQYIIFLYRTRQFTQKQIGEMFGIPPGTISNIITGRTVEFTEG